MRDSTQPASLQTSRSSCQETCFKRWRQAATALHNRERSGAQRKPLPGYSLAFLTQSAELVASAQERSKSTGESSLHATLARERRARYSFQTTARPPPEGTPLLRHWSGPG